MSNLEHLPTLYQEFVTTYLNTPAGHAHLQKYRYCRIAAQSNYQSIILRADQGEDVTELVLHKLLPYADTTRNHRQGAWIHYAPTINGDLRKWYERIGWIQPHEWEQVAAAILTFVRQCVALPDEIAAHCQTFTDHSYAKGFQTGTLTPILNALGPNAYHLFNNKSRRVLNYFTGTTFNQSLLTYPDANTRLHQLVHEYSHVISPAFNPQIAQLFQHEIGNSEEDIEGDAAENAVSAVRLADFFDMFCHWLVSVKKFDFRGTHYWRLAISHDGNLQNIQDEWQEWQEGGFVATSHQSHVSEDFTHVGTLKRAQFDRIRDHYLAQYPDITKKEINGLWSFAHHMKEGDRIIVYTKPPVGLETEAKSHLVLGMGTATGPYYFVPNVERGHCLPVEWDDTSQRELAQVRWRTSIGKIARATFEEYIAAPMIEPVIQTQIDAEDTDTEIAYPNATESAPQIVREPNALYTTTPESTTANIQQQLEPYTLAECAHDTGIDEATLDRWLQAIERRGQSIFYGPPGTGKTFIAEHLARHLASDTTNSGYAGFYQLIQFHPAYAYEDFIQGIRPLTDEHGRIGYALMPGHFRQFCQKAAQHQHTCVLIIDEINRANLTQVFGELMYLLEYRDREISLAAGGSPFRIPANVRIIGTMNTADRSIALIDHALRRRFAFIELEPNYDLLAAWHKQKQTGFSIASLVKLLEQLNRDIGDSHYAIGPAFFLRENLQDELADIWQMEIEPYLAEIFFNRQAQVERWQWRQIAPFLL
ncbi:MAG: AAA family ATPase [Chloroflexota bacterium]